MPIQVGAILETHNFTFYAFGESKTECLEMLGRRWKLHQKKTGATYEFEELLDDVYLFGITAGAYESGELPEPPKTDAEKLQDEKQFFSDHVKIISVM
jgi:hypothetical protein